MRTFAFSGIEAVPVEVQVQISSGAPALLLVGLPDKAVGEARERMRAALSAMGLALPPRRVLINLAPADLLKEGSHFDLPITLGVLAAMEVVPREDLYGYAALGELSLDGTLNPVAGVLPAAIGASTLDLGLICPASQGGEAAWAGRIEVLAAADLLSLINHFRGTQVLTPPETAGVAEAARAPDLAEVKGMETAKRAVEIAAAGGHNLLMIGPPGSGKSMLAARLPGLLPDLTPREALEVSMIHSVAGMLDGGRLVMRPPFREPHHSASQAALTGGGQRAKPGEISLAHRGVLFLDELPEFPKQTLESLRQPMETGRTTVARAAAHITYPARFQLVAAMNPCRCGYLGDASRECGRAPRCARGLPEPDQRPGAGPDRPDGGGAAGDGGRTCARAGRGAERRGGGARGAGAGSAADALRRGWSDQQRRGRQPRCRDDGRCTCAGGAGDGEAAPVTTGLYTRCCGSAARSPIWPVRRWCSGRTLPRRWRSAIACRGGSGEVERLTSSVLPPERIGDAPHGACRIDHHEIEAHPCPRPFRMFRQHDLRCRQQPRSLPRAQRHRRVGKRRPRLHLDDRKQVRPCRDHIDFAGLGAQTLRQHAPAVALQGATRGRLGIDATSIGSDHGAQPVAWQLMSGE